MALITSMQIASGTIFFNVWVFDGKNVHSIFKQKAEQIVQNYEEGS
jgi:hypothetical protein